MLREISFCIFYFWFLQFVFYLVVAQVIMRVWMLIFSASDAAQTAESGAVVVAEDGASTLHMLGAANKYGWYQVGYDETDVWYGTVIDFAEAEEREISAPDSLPMNGRVGNLQVDDAQIVWSYPVC